MNSIQFFSILAAIFVAFSFMPQAIKTIKSKDTSGISLWMYILYTSGVGMWFVYGILKMNFSIILGNFAILIFAIPILIIKIQSVRNHN